MKWKQQLEACGLTEATVSQGLRNKIRDVKDVESQLAQMKATLKNPSVNDDVDELEEAIGNATEDLKDLDNELVAAIKKFNDNKDKYAELAKKMKEGREKKKAGANKPQSSEQKPAQQPAQQPVQQQTQVAKPEIPVTPTEEIKKDEKKKTNWGWVAFAVIGGILTLGAVNFFKDND